MSCEITLALDSGVYPLTVIQRVVYLLAPSLIINIQQSADGFCLLITPTILNGTSGETATAAAVRELIFRHLNDFALRERIQRETSGLREILAAAAMRGAGV